jgi:predicted RNA-binding Zn ribbon-like protein
MHPEKRNDLFFAAIYYQSDAARSHFYTDKDGKIRFTPPSIVQLLEGIEAARIRECPVCYKIFWAGRRDMGCCSTQCSHTQRQRKYRERYLEKYKQQRYDKAEATSQVE